MFIDFIKKFIINNPQCILKIEPYKWLVVILIYSLSLYFELKKIIESNILLHVYFISKFFMHLKMKLTIYICLKIKLQ